MSTQVTTPQRIQLRRTKGFRKPERAIVVSRPSKWGNPFTGRDAANDFERYITLRRNHPGYLADYPQDSDIRAELAGRDLCCWCPVDRPCHAETLLRIANHRSPL